MKICEQVLLYQKGELAGAAKQAFETHLKTCASCQKELKFLEKLDAALTPPAAPAKMVDTLFARTTRKKSVWARLRLGWTITALAACSGVFLWVAAPSPQKTFSAHELVAYMDASANDEYASFAQELNDMEDYF